MIKVKVKLRLVNGIRSRRIKVKSAQQLLDVLKKKKKKRVVDKKNALV